MKESNIEQRSAEWFKIREGKLTSSDASKIMGIKGLGKTGETYAIEKAIELIDGADEEELNTYDILRGVELEPYAFDKFNEIKSIEFLTAVKCGFIQLNKDIGSSPDGLVNDFAVLEIKCPRRSKFYKIVVNGIIEVDKDYLDQVQHQMWVTGRKKAYLMFYIIDKGIEKWHIFEIDRCETTITKLKERSNEAIKLRDEFCEKLKNNKQF